MKKARLIKIAILSLFLLVVSVIEVWTASSLAWGEWQWHMSVANKLELAFLAGVVFVVSVVTFIAGIKKGLMFGFMLALCASLVASCCCLMFFLMSLIT